MKKKLTFAKKKSTVEAPPQERWKVMIVDDDVTIVACKVLKEFPK